ncbi:hypothetical protein L2E82_18936 [Cichorium intybus]|uniref:Uncharacterized protein n=1 Tax=Cichorium intybus TaxID=13427 RepID=A0ACB9FBR3_CICIN|nr:hypothetical protein L2E82_18936 [Cichorium intybus]
MSSITLSSSKLDEFSLKPTSLRNANVKTLWEDDVHAHYLMRRYAEFTASLIQLNVDYGDGQLDLNMGRLKMAIDDLLIKLAKTITKPKLQTMFLINYDMTIAVLKEAGPEGGKIQLHFEEQYSCLCDIKSRLNHNFYFTIRKIWKVPGQTESTLSTEVELISTIAEKKSWTRPPIQMAFQVPMFTSSGLRVRLLKLWEKSGYNTVE